jgi:hypothetical protein
MIILGTNISLALILHFPEIQLRMYFFAVSAFREKLMASAFFCFYISSRFILLKLNVLSMF